MRAVEHYCFAFQRRYSASRYCGGSFRHVLGFGFVSRLPGKWDRSGCCIKCWEQPLYPINGSDLHGHSIDKNGRRCHRQTLRR